TVTSQAIVTKATLSSTAVGITTTAGATFNGTVATFTDDGTISNFNATITWDDGTQSTGVISGNSGHYTVSGGHLYVKPGQNVPVVVAISDTDGESATVTGAAAVADAALTGGPGG